METSEINLLREACDHPGNQKVPHVLNRSEGERLSIEARQKKVLAALQKLGVNATKGKEPPIIAVLGSGGGLRAMVGLLGTLAELAKEDVLDIITYICGTSGSTWCMSSLYNNNNWSSCMAEMECEISDRLAKPAWNLIKSWDKLKETFSKEIYSLTNFWAYMFIHKITNEINEKLLSDHKAACESGENPYPVYSAVEKGHLKTKNKPGTWFEFTPHMAGFPAYKSFIKTEYLGSKFKEGKILLNTPEKDLCYLQGLWGSAPASDHFIHDAIKVMLRKLFPGRSASKSEGAMFEEASSLGIEETSDPEMFCSCTGCQKLGTLLSHDRAGMMTDEREKFYNNFATALKDTMKKSLDDETFKTNKRMAFLKSDCCENSKVMLHIMTSLFHWKWGTTNNFLYEWKSNVPADLYSQKFICLVDAGLEINSAFPLMLLPNRKVDLILSFDFSEGDPFLTLENTAKYCTENKISFPKINVEENEKDIPSQCCYFFEGDGKGTPDVMHFPLFNNQNCEGKVKEMRETYSTLHFSYHESQMKELLQASKLNVKLSKEQILEKLQKRIHCN